MKRATRSRFFELCSEESVSEIAASETWEDLAARYSEPHRRYHDFLHIDTMLGWFDEVSGNDKCVEWAIWFHDCVYEPLAKDNEIQSAGTFRRHMGDCLNESTVKDTIRLIRSTDPALPRSGEPDEDLLIDIDLSVLGSSPEEYAIYRTAIREEYSVVPDAEYRSGRIAVLTGFLSKDRIYMTDRFTELERRARNNLQAEIDLLRNESE